MCERWSERGKEKWHLLNVFVKPVSEVIQPTVTEEKWKDPDLLEAEYISLSVHTMYSRFL